MKNTPALIFIALRVSEYIRQTNKRLLTHGASVELPNGKCVVLLGNQGAGKTTILYHLCKYHGCKIIGNDQIILGLKDEKLEVFGGTKNITIRQTATLGHLPELQSLFIDINENPQKTNWKTKKEKTPEDLGLQISTQSNSEVSAVFWLNLDISNKEEYYVERSSPKDLVESLLLSEKLSRHINGAATPIIGKSGQIALSPSFDTIATLKNRQEIINNIYETGYFAVSGGNLSGILEDIKKYASK